MTKEQKRKVDADRNNTRVLAMAAKLPCPPPAWDGRKPGEHPLLPLKPPGKRNLDIAILAATEKT